MAGTTPPSIKPQSTQPTHKHLTNQAPHLSTTTTHPPTTPPPPPPPPPPPTTTHHPPPPTTHHHRTTPPGCGARQLALTKWGCFFSAWFAGFLFCSMFSTPTSADKMGLHGLLASCFQPPPHHPHHHHHPTTPPPHHPPHHRTTPPPPQHPSTPAPPHPRINFQARKYELL